MNEMPIVSVIVLSYNQQDFIDECLNSVLNQNFPSMEIIVGDDNSTDKTVEMINGHINKNIASIKLITHPENVGITTNFNDCLKYCRGRYIFLLGGDDIFLPGKLSSQVDFMEKNPDIAISYHDVEVFLSETNELLYFYNVKHKPFEGDASTLIRNGTYCCGCSVAIRNINVPNCDARIKYSSDWLWYIEILKANLGTSIGKMPGVYSRYRRHSGNITSSLSANPLAGLHEVEMTLNIIENKYPEEKYSVMRARAERLFAYFLKSLITKNFYLAIKLLSRAMTQNIFAPWYFLRRIIGLGV